MDMIVNTKLTRGLRLLFFAALTVFVSFAADAQARTLSLSEAVQLGLQNSKQLKRSW